MGVLVMSLISFIVGCVAASEDSGDNDALAFAAVWTVLMMLGVLVLGTYIFRKSQTQLSVGYLLGLVVMMANQCLILSVIFGSKSGSGEVAFSVFCSFMFIIYFFFSILLARFRDEIIKKEEVRSIGTNGGAAVPKAAQPPMAV
mmetsp:Transcript_23932/g.75408  ORF Transcript_23932/g.75408 Transcript_23932/m.75408 type:complete len:144 (-) Transcript_23932:128-559(-)